jgi:hypothetical protein
MSARKLDELIVTKDPAIKLIGDDATGGFFAINSVG